MILDVDLLLKGCVVRKDFKIPLPERSVRKRPNQYVRLSNPQRRGYLTSIRLFISLTIRCVSCLVNLCRDILTDPPEIVDFPLKPCTPEQK